MSADRLRNQFNALLAEEEIRSLDRIVHLGTIIERSTGQELYRAGGEWDRQKRAYTGRFEKAHRIRLRPSQHEAVQYGLWWLQERKAGRPRDFVVEFLIGDRGGGKTALGSILAGLFVLEFPAFDGSPSIAWQVSKSHDERDEVDKDLKEFFPFEDRWYVYTEYRGHKYHWVNGATLKNVSADDEEALKRGRVDFIFVNEAGKMGKRVPIYGLGRLKDKGGFGVFTSNRPTARSRWILQWNEKAEEAKAAGGTYPVVFVKVPSADNDTLDRATADQVSTLVNDLDPSLADDDMARLFDPHEKLAYPKFNKVSAAAGGNVAEPPDLGDITPEFTRRKVQREYQFVGSADFQYNPGNVGTFWKIYGTIEAPILWAVDELELPHASEEEYLAEVGETTHYTPANTMWTGDNTGQIQNGRHDPKDRTSFAIWTALGWKIVPNVKPKDRDHRPNNARVERRVGLTNYLLSKLAPAGVKHIMISPKCPRLIRALKDCELKISGKNGMPYPAHPFSHLSDTVGYLAWWAWPKPKAPVKPITGPIYEAVPITPKQVW